MTPGCAAVKSTGRPLAGPKDPGIRAGHELHPMVPSFEDRLRTARAWIEARGRGWMVVGYQKEGFYYDGRGLPGWRFKRWEDVGGDL
jgi:hypothetical protein